MVPQLIKSAEEFVLFKLTGIQIDTNQFSCTQPDFGLFSARLCVQKCITPSLIGSFHENFGYSKLLIWLENGKDLVFYLNRRGVYNTSKQIIMTVS